MHIIVFSSIYPTDKFPYVVTNLKVIQVQDTDEKEKNAPQYSPQNTSSQFIYDKKRSNELELEQ